MKIVKSLLVIFAVFTLTACDGGQGPKKPTALYSTQISQR